MPVLIAVMGLLVTVMVVAGMILMAPGNAEPSTDRDADSVVGAVPAAVETVA